MTKIIDSANIKKNTKKEPQRRMAKDVKFKIRADHK